MKAMKKVKSNRQQKKNKEKPITASAELSSFSLAAAISEASVTNPSPTNTNSQQQSHKTFNYSSINKTSTTSQASIATNTSFATAQESIQQPTGTITPASHFIDSSDDDTEEANFGNDPLAVLSRTNTTESTDTPTEITFSSNPEETMPSKKNKSKVNPVVDTPIEATPVAPAPVAVAPVEQTPVAATKAAAEDEAHFDVAQHVYGGVKDFWAWGKTVPVISNVLGITEAVAAKALDMTVHTDLEAIDNDVAKPTLKKLDDDIVTPVILAIWKIIEPAVGKTEEMVVKPVMKEVIPRVLAPLAMFDQKKKDMDAKKKEEKEAMVDASPTPEVIPALN